MKFHTMQVWSSIGTQKWPGPASLGASISTEPNSDRRSKLGERHDVVVAAHVPTTLGQFAHARVAIAVVGQVHLERRRAAAHERTARVDARSLAGCA